MNGRNCKSDEDEVSATIQDDSPRNTYATNSNDGSPNSKGNGCLHGKCMACPTYCPVAFPDGNNDAVSIVEDATNKKQQSFLGVSLSTVNMYNMNLDIATIEEYCDWSKVSHLFVTCLAISKGSATLHDLHDNQLESASTYMPCFLALKNKFPNLRLVLCFDHVFATAVQEAFINNPDLLVYTIGILMMQYGFNGIELNLNLFLTADSRDIELAFCKSIIYGRIYLRVTGDIDFGNERNLATLKLFDHFSNKVIVNTFGFFQWKMKFLNHGMVKLLQPMSECAFYDSSYFMMKVLQVVKCNKIVSGFSSEAVVFNHSNEGSVYNVYETQLKHCQMHRDTKASIEQLKSQGVFLSVDTLSELFDKLKMVDRHNLAGVMCGDLWNDNVPRAPRSTFHIAMGFIDRLKRDRLQSLKEELQ